MKIRAVRLREVGVFRDAVAVEGFSGGLDILAGPNELGKSTIMRALRRLFLAKHDSSSRDMERLRPHGGGAPLIETDFEAAGRTWRLRKQFLSGRMAELSDLTAGRVVERGADAHERALELIGLGGDETASRAPLGLLWVDQSDGPRPVTVGADERSLLLSAIGSEVSEVAAGHTARVIEGIVGQELDLLVTGHKPPRPKGDYDLSLKQEHRLVGDLEKAKETAAHLEGKRTELERLRGEHAVLSAPAAMAARAESRAAAARRLEEGREARDRLRLAQSAHRERESAKQRIEATLKAVAARLTERKELEQRVARLAPELEATAAAVQAAAQEKEGSHAARIHAEAALRDARSLLQRAERRDMLHQLRQRLAQAQRLSGEMANHQEALATSKVTDSLLRKAEMEQASVDGLRAKIDAAAPRISIAYVAGAQQRILMAGAPLQDGAQLRATGPLILEIPGTGRITIEPTGASDLTECEADLRAHADELAAVLARMHVTDLVTARAALMARQRQELQLSASAEALARIAPDGLAALEARLVAAMRGLDADTPDALPPRDEIVERIATLETEMARAAAIFEAAAEKASKLAQQQERTRAFMQSARERLAALGGAEAEAPPEADLGRLELQVAEETAAANAALREVTAWREAAPDEQAWAGINAALAQADREHADIAKRLVHLGEAMAHCEGELSATADGDPWQKVEELSAELAAVRGRIAGYRREVASLELLRRLFSEAQKTARESFLRPVIERIDPYLRLVMPDARLAFDGSLEPAGLLREGATEPMASLSGGTQEQIAVLTRLGFGKLLAERGRATPVVLDDALVYSDDERIERLFGVLRLASEHHQVIVLTCRSRLFARAGGAILSLRPWRQE